MSTVGDRIKQVIEDEGVTLKEAAIRADTPYRSLQNYISNKQSPGMIFFARFRQAFLTDLNWLITGEKSNVQMLNNTIPPALIDESILENIEIILQNKGCEHPQAMFLAQIYNKVRKSIHSHDMNKEPELIEKSIEEETEYLINIINRFNKLSIAQPEEKFTSNQNFNSSVEQVSGRDINNNAIKK